MLIQSIRIAQFSNHGEHDGCFRKSEKTVDLESTDEDNDL